MQIQATQEPCGENGEVVGKHWHSTTNIFASYDDYTVPLSGKAIPMFGGTFKGNFIVAGNAYCLQQVNPIDLKKMDAYYKKAGQSSLHELTESYIGGRLALPLNFGDLRTGQNNMFYHL